VLNLDRPEARETFEYAVTVHLRMSGVYWSLMTMDLIGCLNDMPLDEIAQWTTKCFDPTCGGYGGNEGHDAHLLYTLSALQILAICDRMDLVDKDKVAAYIAGLQQSDGSFVGDQWGEVDTRFSYCALNAMALLGRMDQIDVDKAVQFISRCRNFDGGFGAVPGAESHSGQIFCCMGALGIAGPKALQQVDAGLLGWWLAERQLPVGGLNGRPEKKPDVCYSWWILSSLAIVDKIAWIDAGKLGEYILACQDPNGGGISDRPGNMTDIFHTYFGIAGLSLLGYPDLAAIDPIYALPQRIVDKMNLPNRYQPKKQQQHQRQQQQQQRQENW